MNMEEYLIKNSFNNRENQYNYYKPSQARRIPLKASNNRGFHPSLKPHLKGFTLEYELN